MGGTRTECKVKYLIAVEEVLDITEPTIVNCDNGSEFISNTLKKNVKERSIDVRYADVKDHHKLAIVD